jgi:hypothetical protein
MKGLPFPKGTRPSWSASASERLEKDVSLTFHLIQRWKPGTASLHPFPMASAITFLEQGFFFDTYPKNSFLKKSFLLLHPPDLLFQIRIDSGGNFLISSPRP